MPAHFSCLAQEAGLGVHLILHTPSVGNAAFPHGHSFRPRRRNFSRLRLSAFGIFFERPLMSRSAHSYKPFKAGKNHLLSAHRLENQTPDKHLQCVRMLWNVRKGLPSQEWAPPGPSGESGLGLEGALWLWASGALQAECFTATLVSTHLAAWQLRPSYSSHLQRDSSLCPWISTHLPDCSIFPS